MNIDPSELGQLRAERDQLAQRVKELEQELDEQDTGSGLEMLAAAEPAAGPADRRTRLTPLPRRSCHYRIRCPGTFRRSS